MTTAYRVKMTNLACLDNKRIIPLSMAYGGLSWQIKGPLTLLGRCSILRGFAIGCNIRMRVVVFSIDKIIPLVIISIGFISGLALSNYKNKNFRSILILRPTFQKARFFSVRGEIAKAGDIGFTEELGGPGILAYLKNFFFSFHPIISISLIALFRRLL